MPYKPEEEQTIVISKYHHKLLQELKLLNRYGIGKNAERAIELLAKEEGILELKG
jgi:hypothetical protein